MSVKAKFYIAEVHQYATSSGWAPPAPRGKVILRAVSRGEENAEWASATPSGVLEMTVHGDAFPWFQDRLGADVSITLDDATTP